MAERERGKDRAAPGHNQASSGVWSTLFGKRTPVVPTTSRAHATSESRSRERDPEARRSSIVEVPVEDTFNLDVAIEMLRGDEKVDEVINATAVWLSSASVNEQDFQILYTLAYDLAKDHRLPALRLLAELVTLSPPSASAENPINNRTLYALATQAPQTNAGIALIRALTKDGLEIQYYDGIVGWLLRAITQDPSDPAPINLLHGIIRNHTPIFSPDDLSRILIPILDGSSDPIPSISMLSTLWKETFLPDDLLQRVMIFLCTCMDQGILESHTLLQTILDPGRRGEYALRTILEGKAHVKSKLPNAAQKVTRGAVL
jgi:hypothetical protein